MHTNTESWAIISATSSKGGKNKTENPSCDILTASNFPLNKNITKLTDEIKITINYKPSWVPQSLSTTKEKERLWAIRDPWSFHRERREGEVSLLHTIFKFLLESGQPLKREKEEMMEDDRNFQAAHLWSLRQ